MAISDKALARSPIHLTGRDSFERDRARMRMGGGNRLIQSSNQTRGRKQVPLLDTDVHRNVSTYGRRILMSLGRHIYFSCAAIRQTVKELSKYAASSFIWEYRGDNREWGTAAEALLHDHGHMADIAGPPYTLACYRTNLVRAAFIDGDIGTIYCKHPETGLPCFQTIPSHRISSAGEDDIVKGGPFDGATLIQGVIVDEYMRPLGYRVLTGDVADLKSYQDVPVESMSLFFIPEFVGQLRGFSNIGLVAWDVQDRSEARRFELLAQKAGAGRVFVEWNDEGEPPPGADYVTAPEASATTEGHPSGMWYETIGEGINTYFRAGAGHDIKPVPFDRPSANQREFGKGIDREVIGALGGNYDFVIDPTAIGGHASRVMVSKLNRNLEAMQDDVVEPACRRFDAFRLGCFMEDLGMLPFQEDWHRYEYQGPPQWTGDRRHDSDTDLQEVRAGWRSRSEAVSRRGESLMQVRSAKDQEVEDLLARAKRIKDKYATENVSIEFVLKLLEDDSQSTLVIPNTSDQQAPMGGD